MYLFTISKRLPPARLHPSFVCTIVHFYYRQSKLANDMTINIVVNVIFSIALIIHVFMVAYGMIYPNIPSVRVFKKSINQIDFPVSIKICATEDRERDIKRHSGSGYTRSFKFFLGQSMFNRSLIGWKGHTKNGSTIGSTQGI